MSKSVMIVEDEENDVFFLKRAFKQTGFEHPVQVVENGQQAIDYLSGDGKFADRQTFPLPCLILLDLKLPQVHGLNVLKWIRAQPRFAPVPIVVFTSSKLDDDIERAYRLGANSYVVKPSSLDKLVEFVRDLNSWWFKHIEFPRPNVEH